MTTTTPITIFAANCRGNPTNCLYPNRIEITDETTAAKAFSRDIVCAEYRNNYRNNDNFLISNALPEDCDNDHSDDPSQWISPKDVTTFFAGVTCIIHYSRTTSLLATKFTKEMYFTFRM